ncbi:MAG: radical SAM protein [Desulfomicrobiaceae bacterium]
MCRQKDRSVHPCFEKKSACSVGRVHLPVAPTCNIQCNYCDRKHDCINESRPGVTSAVLSPTQASAYLDMVLEREPRIRVVGIAGPGDPLAEPSRTLETIRLVAQAHPELLFCLSTNGLGLPDVVDALADLGVTHATVTVNAVDPKVGSQIYRWVRFAKRVYRGEEGARLLFSRQEEGIRRLKERGMTVKVNTIVIPTVTENHVLEVSRWAAGLGVDIQNLLPLCPAAQTPFAALGEPEEHLVEALRNEASALLPQMRHCQRCRADAVGLLHADQSRDLAPVLRQVAHGPAVSRPYVAVASREGLLVNQHLGEAAALQIWQPGQSPRLVATRPAPEPGGGDGRWRQMAQVLGDCSAVLVRAAGARPKEVLSQQGITVYEVEGLVRDVLAAYAEGQDMGAFRPCSGTGCRGALGGGGVGCGA